MAFLELLVGYWWVILLAAFAFFAGYVALTVRDELAARGYKLRYSFARGFHPVRTDAGTNGDSDADCRANLDRAVNRKSGRRSIQRLSLIHI